MDINYTATMPLGQYYIGDIPQTWTHQGWAREQFINELVQAHRPQRVESDDPGAYDITCQACRITLVGWRPGMDVWYCEVWRKAKSLGFVPEVSCAD